MSTSILQKILNKTTQFIETLQKKVENREQIQKYRSQKKKNKVNNTTEIFADVNLRLKIKYLGAAVVKPDPEEYEEHIPECLKHLKESMQDNRYDGFRTPTLTMMIKKDSIALMDNTLRHLFKELSFDHLLWFGTHPEYQYYIGIIVRNREKIDSNTTNNNNKNKYQNSNNGLHRLEELESNLSNCQDQCELKRDVSTRKMHPSRPGMTQILSASSSTLNTINAHSIHNQGFCSPPPTSKLNKLKNNSNKNKTGKNSNNINAKNSSSNFQRSKSKYCSSTPNLSILENIKNNYCLYLFKGKSMKENCKLLQILQKSYKLHLDDKYTPSINHSQNINGLPSFLVTGSQSNHNLFNFDTFGGQAHLAATGGNHLPPLSVREHLSLRGSIDPNSLRIPSQVNQFGVAGQQSSQVNQELLSQVTNLANLVGNLQAEMMSMRATSQVDVSSKPTTLQRGGVKEDYFLGVFIRFYCKMFHKNRLFFLSQHFLST